MVEQPQANPKVHPVDYIAFILMLISAIAMYANELPPKFAGIVMALGFFARLYTKWLGSQQDKDAVVEGEQAAIELKSDLEVLKAVKAEPIATLQK